MYEWEDHTRIPRIKKQSVIIFGLAAISSSLLIFVFGNDLDTFTRENPLIVSTLFIPIFILGFVYGNRLTEQVINPGTPRTAFKHKVIKISLLIFLISILFSTINFALNNLVQIPQEFPNQDILEFLKNFINANGGTTFLVISSITILAIITKKMLKINGVLNTIFTFMGTFILFFMTMLTISNTDPTPFQIYGYTCYQAGIVGGAFYVMYKYSSRSTAMENYMNEF